MFKPPVKRVVTIIKFGLGMKLNLLQLSIQYDKMCVNECKYESCFYSKTQDNFYATKRKEKLGNKLKKPKTMMLKLFICLFHI